MRSIKFLAAALLAIAMPAAAQRPTPLGPTPSLTPLSAQTTSQLPAGAPALAAEDLNAWLDGYMHYAIATGDIAGAVVVVVKDGQVLARRGFGYADVARRKPVDPNRTLFRPGSVSKLFTWTAVMQLVEQGRLDLDADVNRYLDFKIPPRDGKPITMRQIMTHTGGFEESGKYVMFYDPARLMPLGEYLRAKTPERIFAPGVTPAYSNYATALAGYVVERVSRRSFDDYVEEHIFAPLGMRNSTFRQPLPRRFAGMMSRGYDRASDEPAKYEIVGPAPAGSLASTGADMARFMIAHLNDGAGLLRPETARMMHDTSLTLLPPLNRMALGFFETNINGRRVIAHLGDTQAFHTSLHLFQAEKVGFYVSFNSLGKDGAAGGLRGALFTDFADRYFPGNELTGRVDAKTAAEHARMMAGVWRNSRRSESNFFAIAELLGQVTTGVGPKGELTVPLLKGLGDAPRNWVEVAPFVWHDRNSHERLAAKVVDGKVVRWSIDGISPFMVFDRVPISKSSVWLLPALYVSLAVLALTFVLWPVTALVRRRYGAALAVEGRDRLAYRGVRAAAALILAVLIGWAVLISVMSSDIDNFTSAVDPWLWLLQIAGLIAFVGGLAVMLWNAWLVWKGKRRWTSKLWSVVLVLAAAVILWIAIVFKLLAFTVNF